MKRNLKVASFFVHV